jgi:hypothetical protein
MIAISSASATDVANDRAPGGAEGEAGDGRWVDCEGASPFDSG